MITWCHCTPTGTPALRCIAGIRFEEHLDDVACTFDVGWQGGATGPRQQDGPVPVRDSQFVVAVYSFECSEL